jgi:hypothetical protein
MRVKKTAQRYNETANERESTRIKAEGTELRGLSRIYGLPQAGVESGLSPAVRVKVALQYKQIN